MGSLQVGLAVLGALVLAGVMAHGAWQARKWSRPHPAVAAHGPQEPVEPTFGPVDAGLAVDTAMSAPVTDPDVMPRRSSALPAPIDPLIDAIATLRLDAPVSGEQAIAALPPTRRVGSKPMMVEGLDAETGQWQPLSAGGSFSELQAGIQMANRSGALNEIEYSEFVQKLQACADAIGASAEFPDMLDVVARARELDLFAGEHDAQLAMRLHTRGSAWSVGFITHQAARFGFVPGALPGRLVLPAAEDGAPPILSLQFDRQAALADEPGQANVREVTLALDVPQTAADREPFKAWRRAGHELGQALNAMVTDDQGRELTDESFGVIAGEIVELYHALAQHDLAAGSPAARRLFS